MTKLEGGFVKALRPPFVICASSFFRHSDFGIRHLGHRFTNQSAIVAAVDPRA